MDHGRGDVCRGQIISTDDLQTLETDPICQGGFFMEETQMNLELGHIRLILQKYQERSLLRDAPLVTFWSRLRPRLPREICFFFLIVPRSLEWR